MEAEEAEDTEEEPSIQTTSLKRKLVVPKGGGKQTAVKVKTAKPPKNQNIKVVKRPASQPVCKRPAKVVTLKMPKSPQHGGKPVHLDTVKIYTDTKAKSWRVQAFGHKKDKGFPFHAKTIAKAESWGSLLKYINSGKYV